MNTLTTRALSVLLLLALAVGCSNDTPREKTDPVTKASTVSMALPAADAEGTTVNTIAAGQPVASHLTANHDQLDNGAYYDIYEYTGTVGERLTITMIADDLDALDPHLMIGRDTGNGLAIVAENDDRTEDYNSEISFRLLNDEPIYIIVNSAYGEQTGGYTLTVEARPSPEVEWAQRYAQRGDPNAQYAVLVGINDYPGTGSDLNSSVEDAELMRDVLITTYGFRPENIVMITDQDATREHIMNAFIRHLGQAGPNGTAVFYYSGHGSYTEDQGVRAPLDQEDDGRDETLAVWGDDAPDSWTEILDDELGFMIDELRAGNTLIIIDSCHSGTSTRGGQTVTKLLDKADMQASFKAPADFIVNKDTRYNVASSGPARLGELLGNRMGNHILLSAAKAEETALAWLGVGPRASVFTHFLIEALREGGNMSFADMMSRVQEETVDHAANYANGHSQTPQAEGTRLNESVAAFLGKPADA